MATKYLAVDLGAESGRVMVGEMDGGRIVLDEVHRFHNGPVQVRGGAAPGSSSLHWDVLALWREIKAGLTLAAQRHGRVFAGLGVDTWGIDFALLDDSGLLLGNPHAYRDPRTASVMDQVLAEVSRQEIYETSGGIQFMGINTLYQLKAMALSGDPRLAAADSFLMMPDLFNFWLTGRKVVEFTNATSTQFYDSRAGRWAFDLLARLGIRSEMLPDVAPTGTVLGMLLPEVASEVGLEPMPVIAVATHDTASAVVAVPAAEDEFLWLSSGTWSLLGGVADAPLVTAEALAANLSSYGGAGGKVLPWRNIMGLWLMQECRRIWERQGHVYSYEQLAQMAEAAPPFAAIINPDDGDFLAPADMPAAIRAYCERTGQTTPADAGGIVRASFEGLALRYRWVTERLEGLSGRRFPVLHIVGGGAQNRLLCQFAADALGRPVLAGPVEATALGNVAVQAVATGAAPSLHDVRRGIREAAAVQEYRPGVTQGWDAAYARFCALPGI